MEGQGSQFFSLLVVGDNPDEMVKKYDANIKVEPYIKYKYCDAKKLRTTALKTFKQVIDSKNKLNINDFVIDYFMDRYNAIKSLSDFEYYTTITAGLAYDGDGNAITDENPDGKWASCYHGKNMCIPFVLKDSKKMVYSAKVGDVDWDEMHLGHDLFYRATWQLVHGEREPKTDQEKQIYDNNINNKRYFANFKDEDEYVIYCDSYWTNAYLDENGWQDAEDKKNFDWISNYYEKFIKNLPDDSTITLFECTKPKNINNEQSTI